MNTPWLAVLIVGSLSLLLHLLTAVVARARVRRRDDEIDRLRRTIREMHEQERRPGYWCTLDHTEGTMRSARRHWHPAVRS